MKRLLALAIVLLSVVPAFAQVQPSGIGQGVTPPIFGLPSSLVNGGGSFTPQLFGPQSCTVPAYSYTSDTTSGWGLSSSVLCPVVGGVTLAQFANGSIGGNSALLGNTISGGTITAIGSNANEFVGLGHFNFGATMAFRNSSNEFEFWGYNGTAYQPVLSIVSSPTGKGFVSIRKPDDSRGISLTYATASNPTITVEVPAGTNNAGADLDIGGGPGTGSGTPGSLRFMAAAAGGSGTTEQTLTNVGLIRSADVQFYVPMRLGSSNVAGTGSLRFPNNVGIYARNNGNTNNIAMIDTTTADVLRVGGDGSNITSIDLLAPVKFGSNTVTNAAIGVAGGYKIARGSTAFDGSNPTTVATGLTSVVSCTATLLRTSAVSSGSAFVTHAAASGANVDFYAWLLTGAASTGTETFEWICVGT